MIFFLFEEIVYSFQWKLDLRLKPLEFTCQSKGFRIELLIFKTKYNPNNKELKNRNNKIIFLNIVCHSQFFILFFCVATTQSVKLFLCISIIMKSTPISNIHICTTYVVSEHRRKEWKIDTHVERDGTDL